RRLSYGPLHAALLAGCTALHRRRRGVAFSLLYAVSGAADDRRRRDRTVLPAYVGYDAPAFAVPELELAHRRSTDKYGRGTHAISGYQRAGVRRASPVDGLEAGPAARVQRGCGRPPAVAATAVVFRCIG